jgi:hypothetical protein
MDMALAMYFQTLREQRPTGRRRPLSQAWVAQQVSAYLDRTVHPSTISRVESTGETGPDILAALIEVLEGDFEDVKWFASHPQAKPEDGRQRALAALATEIPTEEDLEAVIVAWKNDRKLRRSIGSLLRARPADRASDDVNH